MSDSDSDEFFDAADELSKATRKTSRQSISEPEVVQDTFDDELEKLKEEQRRAEERRKQEDEAIQEKLRELERKKREKEEEDRKRLEEERLQQEKEKAERERREQEEEQKRKEQQEAIERRQEAERRRRRLELLRDNGDDESSPEDVVREAETKLEPVTGEEEPTQDIPIKEEPKPVEPATQSSPEPDLVAMTKTKQPPSEDPVPPPPVAPPRRKKKRKPAGHGLIKPDTLSIDTMSVSSVPSVQGDDFSVNSEVISVGAGLPSENEPKDVLTPTTTIESITKELEHSLDLASAVHGGVVLHMDTQSIKGDSKREVEQARAAGKFDEKQRKNTPDSETLMMYDNIMKEGRTAQGTQLTDEEILSLVMVKNLDTGEKVSLLKAEEQLPQCVNPLALHIMRLTSEYVSNNSLDKDLSEEEKEHDVKIPPNLKKKGKKLKSFLSKTASRIKHKADEQFHREKEEELSEEELLPDTISLKFKASSSNKGPHDFDQIKFAQDMSGEHTGAIWTMKFSPCGRLLATGGQDHLLRVWVLKDHYTYFDDMRIKYSNQQLHPSEEPTTEGDKHTPELSTDDTSAAPSEADIPLAESGIPLASANNELEVFAPSPFCTYTGHTADLLDISWSKNYFLLSSSMDKMVRLWHISRSECLCCFQHIDFVTAIAFHPKDDRYFLSGSLDGKLRLWNIPDKRVALWNEIDGPTKLITAANFIQNGRFAVIGTYDGRCIFFDTEHLKYYTQIHVRSTRGRNAKGRKITAIEPLPGQDKILVTSNDSRIRLYDLRDLSLACKYKGALNLSSQIRASFSHTHKYIISGSEDHSVYIWKTSYDFAKFTSVRKDRNDYWESFKAHDAVVTASVFSPNPSLVLNRLGGERTATPGSELGVDKREEKSDSSEDRSEKRSSLKKNHDQPEVIVSADFSGTIKVFFRETND